MTNPLSATLDGQTLAGRFRILSLIGEGGMGSVYLAEDTTLGRKVALKFIHRELTDDAQIKLRIENECRLLASLAHPGIVTLYNRHVIDGNVVLEMEYVPGEPLSEILKRAASARSGEAAATAAKTVVVAAVDHARGAAVDTFGNTFGPADARAIADLCLAALEFAHRKGIVHRDIKPANILVARDQQGELTVKIADFGIAKAVGGEGAETAATALTRTGFGVVGTPAYMAPEQVDSNRFGAIGPASDLYAMGITLFEMLTLRRPFNGTATEILYAQANVPPPSPHDFNPSLPDGFVSILRRALLKHPEERYRSAAEFRMDLAAAGGGTIVTPLPGREPKGREKGSRSGVHAARQERKGRGALIAACLGGALLLGAGGYYLYSRIPTGGEKLESSEPAPIGAPAPASPTPSGAAPPLPQGEHVPASVHTPDAAPTPVLADGAPSLDPNPPTQPTSAPDDAALWSEVYRFRDRWDRDGATEELKIERARLLDKASKRQISSLVTVLEGLSASATPGPSSVPPPPSPDPAPAPPPAPSTHAARIKDEAAKVEQFKLKIKRETAPGRDPEKNVNYKSALDVLKQAEKFQADGQEERALQYFEQARRELERAHRDLKVRTQY